MREILETAREIGVRLIEDRSKVFDKPYEFISHGDVSQLKQIHERS